MEPINVSEADNKAQDFIRLFDKMLARIRDFEKSVQGQGRDNETYGETVRRIIGERNYAQQSATQWLKESTNAHNLNGKLAELLKDEPLSKSEQLGIAEDWADVVRRVLTERNALRDIANGAVSTPATAEPTDERCNNLRRRLHEAEEDSTRVRLEIFHLKQERDELRRQLPDAVISNLADNNVYFALRGEMRPGEKYTDCVKRIIAERDKAQAMLRTLHKFFDESKLDAKHNTYWH